MIKTAIDEAANDMKDGASLLTVGAAGLVSQGDKGISGALDETWSSTVGPVELRVNHAWHDTSKSIAVRSDRTRVRLGLVKDGKQIDS
ncbi:hypothetical protein DSM25558_4368 [Agrobacterium sp. DSM 25558]|uniref:hypothetical protein n=1 Tax=Agrobacterium sp. DSM 25558 TaxID=1907665 RepID=UPI0009724797|nr:hypothetical protein [Agrobacterium sp. DSM 25558]SCX28086.1 hypothetical protein DSM25558_4368 [Agrobacterium sp. DSM 25558]